MTGNCWFKVDPGSKTSGIALVASFKKGKTLVWAANLSHRGAAVHANLESRRSLRVGRRGRKTRYRKARFDNRTRKPNCGGKWLAPCEWLSKTAYIWRNSWKKVCLGDSLVSGLSGLGEVSRLLWRAGAN